MSQRHNIIKSFPFAFEGIKSALKTEPNLRVHFVLAIIALFLGFILRLNSTELAILTLTIGFVITLEFINTMLEALVNLVSPEIRPTAKVAKDVSAAAVLISAITSLVIGSFLFLPKIADLL